MIRSAASCPTLAVETTGWRIHLGLEGQRTDYFTHDDENFSLEVALRWGVELVMHGTDVGLCESDHSTVISVCISSCSRLFSAHQRPGMPTKGKLLAK